MEAVRHVPLGSIRSPLFFPLPFSRGPFVFGEDAMMSDVLSLKPELSPSCRRRMKMTIVIADSRGPNRRHIGVPVVK